MLPSIVFVLGVAWPLMAANGQATRWAAVHSHAVPTSPAGGGAPLFESVDENLEPINMADMIDGKPLVLAVSSCT